MDDPESRLTAGFKQSELHQQESDRKCVCVGPCWVLGGLHRLFMTLKLPSCDTREGTGRKINQTPSVKIIHMQILTPMQLLC